MLVENRGKKKGGVKVTAKRRKLVLGDLKKYRRHNIMLVFG